MAVYIPNTKNDREEMLSRIGADAIGALFSDIPEPIRLKGSLKLDAPQSEAELLRDVKALAAQNKSVEELTCFLGAGAYDRLVPSAVRHLTLRSEFYTAYTPYQPEISQGTLRAIFEFQTMIASLTGMDVANASMYDGASACAEAMLMAVHKGNRNRILISETVHPETKAVVDTYARFNGVDIVTVPVKAGAGVTDADKLAALMSEDVAGVIVQSPNFFGLFEDIAEIEPVVHAQKALLIASVVDPLALALTESPGKAGADIAVGEGQSFGIAMNFGGPYLGFMAAKSALMRKLPGRIVGETVDVDGRRAFVLTLQAREQHIRRDKATSNICSNQGLNALTATIYLSLLGQAGLREAAERSLNNAHYLQKGLEEIGIRPLFDGPFFDEFAAVLRSDAEAVYAKLLQHGILGGYPLGCRLREADYPDRNKAMLFCATEKRTKAEIDRLVSVLAEIDK